MESVEEFLARGGKIRTEPIRRAKADKLPPGEALRRRLTMEKRAAGLKP